MTSKQFNPPMNNDYKSINETMLIHNKHKQDTFIYKSSDMVNFMSPSGIWSSEIIDARHIVFRRAQDAVDIRPGKKLNVLMCSLLIMNMFYDELLSYILMFAIWCSVVCMCAPDHYNVNNGIYSWNSLGPQLLLMVSYGKTSSLEFAGTLVCYLLTTVERFDEYLFNIAYDKYGYNAHVEEYSSSDDENSSDGDEDEYDDEDSDDENSSDGDEDECDDEDSDIENSIDEDEDECDDEDSDIENSIDEDECDNASTVTDCSSKMRASMPDLMTEERYNECLSFCDDLCNILFTDTHLINWVKSAENDLIRAEDYSLDISNNESDEQWLFNFACGCVEQSISLDTVLFKFKENNNNLCEYKDIKESNDELIDDDGWDHDIDSREFVRMRRDGMWLRSKR
jgi:hypothetical protein